MRSVSTPLVETIAEEFAPGYEDFLDQSPVTVLVVGVNAPARPLP